MSNSFMQPPEQWVSPVWLRKRLRKAKAKRKRSTEPNRFARYHDDPAGYFRDVLKVEPWENPGGGFGPHGQGDILRAVATHPTVACRSGHKTGKSISAAGLALWYFDTREEARVIFTAPTMRQVEEVVWREIGRLVRRSGRENELFVPVSPQKGIKGDGDRQLFGFAAVNPDAFSGISGRNVFYIVDEASGVDERIFEALQGNRAGGAKLYMPGNPTQVTGTFFDAFRRKQGLYKTLHIDSRDAAKFGGDIPGLATDSWVQDCIGLWTEKDPRFDVRVKGDFPSQSTCSVISLGLLEAARARYQETEHSGRLVIGLDVAREGDDETVIMPVRGMKTYSPAYMKHEHGLELVLRGADGEQIAQQVHAVAEALRDKNFDGAEPIRVNVDVIGVGASPYDAMCYGHGEILSPCAVNAGHKADDDEQYVNMRAQLHFGLAQWLKDGGAIHDDEDLDADLLAAEFSFDVRNRQKVERKEDIKKRLGRSPDRADALMLAVYGGDYEVPDLSGLSTSHGSRWAGSGGRGWG